MLLFCRHIYKPSINRKSFFALLLFLAGGFTFAQKELAQADKLVAEKRYGEAIAMYDKIYDKKKDRAVLLKLADANYLNENYPQAQKYYAEYFKDSVYEHIPQFLNYAESSKSSGKIGLAVRLYQKHYEINQDTASKQMIDIYKLFVDSAQYVRSYDLDSNYNCVNIDATESLDSMAAPMIYSWQFDDGTVMEGVKLEHCFANDGPHQAVLNVTDKKTGLVRQKDTLLWMLFEHLPVQFSAPKTIKRYFFTTFDASATAIPGYSIVDYLWSMDDGETRGGKKIKYKYNNDVRDYRVRLVVIAKEETTGRYKLFSANRNVSVVENYETPNKKFSDALNGAK